MSWKAIWESHGGRIFGVASGLVCGFIYLAFGFWDMLFFAFVVFIGYTFGKRSDLRQGPLYRWQEWGRWLTERWRLFK
ncbi:DUF2273 domain-containing protein [Paenibacillus sp. F411]|nr:MULTISPECIES: DUF2273 domain-containing protein [Paenibacillus]MBO2945113.1 DUF2273 domain-containing protein [Paenibacillus sp. F411]